MPGGSIRISRDEWIGNFRFIEYREAPAEKEGAMVLALPDAGLVGVIAASYMVSKLGLAEVGGVDSPYFSPIAIVSRGLPRPPVRIFSGKGVVSVITEIAFTPDIVSQLVSSIVDYARINGIGNIIGITGLPVHNRLDIEDLQTYYVSSSEDLQGVLEKSGAKMLEHGVLVGPYAVLLKEAVRKRVKTFVLLTESFLEFPDPEAAARSLTTMSRIVNLEIDAKDLLDQAEVIKIRAREAMRRAVGAMSSMRKDLEYSPLIYT